MTIHTSLDVIVLTLGSPPADLQLKFVRRLRRGLSNSYSCQEGVSEGLAGGARVQGSYSWLGVLLAIGCLNELICRSVSWLEDFEVL